MKVCQIDPHPQEKLPSKSPSLLGLKTKYVENAQDIEGKTGDDYIRVELIFSKLMTESFEASNIKHQIHRMFAHIKTQVENPQIPGSGFMLDQIKHVHTSIYNLKYRASNFYIFSQNG